MTSLQITALPGLPEINPGDDLARDALRTRAAPIDSRWMSSASTRSLAACTGSAPKPFTTRTPATLSSTTVASCACSACTASTAGWMVREKRWASRLTSGSGASATRASSGCEVSSTTITAITIASCEVVIGIITTKPWICSRSLDARLISCPVWVRSW